MLAPIECCIFWIFKVFNLITDFVTSVPNYNSCIAKLERNEFLKASLQIYLEVDLWFHQFCLSSSCIPCMLPFRLNLTKFNWISSMSFHTSILFIKSYNFVDNILTVLPCGLFAPAWLGFSMRIFGNNSKFILRIGH